jgi:hypothetical protein
VFSETSDFFNLNATSRKVAGYICSVLQLLLTANVVPRSPIFFTLMMEAISSSEMSLLTRATGRKNQEDAILHSNRRENLKSYIEHDS